MGESNVMLMCLIFLLAGAFAAVSRSIGAVDAIAHLGLSVMPPALLLPGLFVVAALVSLTMGTSMGHDRRSRSNRARPRHHDRKEDKTMTGSSPKLRAKASCARS